MTHPDILATLRAFQAITSTPGRGSTRVAYSPEEDAALAVAWARMSTTGALERVFDAAGNMFVVPAAARAAGTPMILVGSHLDTVIEGGWLDGALGVAVGMWVVARAQADPGACPVGLVVFRDEEGVRFNTGLFGSRVVAGQCRPEDLDIVGRDGRRVRDVVPDPDGCVAYQCPVDPAAFFECHIEQGARLETEGLSIGVVTSIVGIRRFDVVSTGEANHAGTTEMARRVDALQPVAAAVASLPEVVAGLGDAVVNCGVLKVEPGAANVVPGRVTAVIEIRGPTPDVLDTVERRVRGLFTPPPGSSPPSVEMRLTSSVAPTAVDDGLIDALARVLTRTNVSHRRLASMAGHDTQAVAARCPAAMFFVPSIGGISHNPAENSSERDIRRAGEVMEAWVREWSAGRA